MLQLPSAASFKQVNKSLEPVRLQGSFGGSLALYGVVWACSQAETLLGYSILDLTRVLEDQHLNSHLYRIAT